MTTVACLHLWHRVEREGSLLKEIEGQSEPIQIAFFEGVHEKKNTKKAICEGHQRIVRFAQENNLQNIIICEDDLRFTSPNSFKYFLSQIPKSYDIFCAMTYVCTKKEGNRLLGPFSGGLTLFSVNQRFYETFLNINPNVHLDRFLGEISPNFEMNECPLVPAYQSGGLSDNLKQVLFYDVYLENRELFNG